MTFRSQPLKKSAPQGKKFSCGHSVSGDQKVCPVCSAKKVDQAEEKKRMQRALEKIGALFSKDNRSAEKSAIVLSRWVNKIKK